MRDTEASETSETSETSESSGSRSENVARTGMIAALYAVATLVTMFVLQGLSWGLVQIRISEALMAFALFSRSAIRGLGIGCAIANLLAIPLAGTGALGLLDVFFGTLATVLGAMWCWKMREHKLLGLFGPVITNALIVPAYLPFVLTAAGAYTIPFTDIAITGAYPILYLVGVAGIGIGELVSVIALGYPLSRYLAKTGLFTDKPDKSE